MTKPTVYFCTTCKGRVQHIERTLRQNIHHNPDAKFILVDYNSQDYLIDYLKARCWEEICSGQLTVYSYKEDTPFRMAHAKNMAHRLAIVQGAKPNDILCNIDADNFTGAGFAKYLVSQFTILPTLKQEVFMWSRMVKDGDGRLPRGISGRIAVTARQFLNSGGYDEKFETWSPDDKDFNFRLRRMGYTAHEIDQYYLNAILHNDKMRFREYRHAKDLDYDDFVVNNDNTVVNYGFIGCGVVYKNFSGIPTILERLPTRIFGIGMHKTATTSLHTALTILGLDSAHWAGAHWAKRIYQEMTTETQAERDLRGYEKELAGDQIVLNVDYHEKLCLAAEKSKRRSSTLERHYALCDLPITLLYKELDKAYPGSKFILTVRDPAKWIESVRNHWDGSKNPYRHRWNTDPFTHKVHKLLYGQRNFDAEKFLARYHQHNVEVFNYFAGRSQDLLVLDMDENVPPDWKWAKLCTFLDVPTPNASVDYPNAFITKKGDSPL